MAACSEQEVDGNPSETTLHRTSLSSSKNDDREQYNVRNSNEMLKVNSSEVEKQNKPQDLKNLSDDEFLNLLEEASTFNKPSNQASDLLQQLRNEIAEKDSCGNVDQNESSHNADHGTLVYGRNRKSRNAFTKGRGSHGMDILLADALSVGTRGCSSAQKPVENHINKKRSGTTYKSKEDPSVKGVIDISRLDKSGLQSQSLQDLATTKLDSIESIKNIGIGRGMRRLQKSQRASSFTSSEVSEHAAQLHLSALEPIRTSLKDAKSTFSKFRQNSLPPDGASSERNALSGKAGVSSLIRNNCAALEDCEVLNSSPERTCNNRGSCVNKGSSCDNVCNRFKYEASKTSSIREYKNSSAISIVSAPLELELKEIKVKKKIETDNIAENMIEHIYHQRCDSKTYKDNTDVDVSVGFPLNCGHIRSQCNLVQSSMESISSDQGLPNVLKGIHCENKSNGDDRTQKKKKKNLRQENAVDGNVFQEILPSSSFIRSFDDSRQFCAVDINGNPKPYHSSSKVPYGITAVLPSTFDCYSPGSSFHSENHSKSDLTLRKSKRNRNNIDNQKYIMAEQIAGHRGQEDIDSLLDFINSSDNKVKAAKTNGSNNGPNQMCTSGGKHLVTLEAEKKKEKISVKTKHHPGCSKRKPSHLSSEEDESQEKSDLQDRELDSKHIPSVENYVAKGETAVISKWSDDNELQLSTEDKPSSTSLSLEAEPSLHLLVSTNFSPTASFTKECATSTKSTNITGDIYDNVGQQKFEESEFRVVLKKQRKRYPVRKSDSSRRYYSNSSNSNYNEGPQYFDQTTHKDDIMLLRGLPLSHRSQRNKQDCTRRKSTSSVPPSEHSSADNSDLDSVHSLPVSGSVPPPTRTHPHTTPPSTSSTPQASYADIARMSIAPTPKSYCNSLYGTFACNIEQNTLKSDSTSVLADLLSSSIDCPDNISEKDGNNNNHSSVLGCSETNVLENHDSIEGFFAADDDKVVQEESLHLVGNHNTSVTLKTSSESTSQEISVTNCPDNNVDDSTTSHAKCISDCGSNKDTDKFQVCKNSHVLSNPKCFENNCKTVDKTNTSHIAETQLEGAVRTEMQIDDINQSVPNNALLNTSALTENVDEQSPQQTVTISDNVNFPETSNAFVDTSLGNPKPSNTKTKATNPDSELESSTLAEQLSFSGRQDRPPVIIMDNYLPTESACDVSFGIDPDELLQLSTGGSIVTNTSHSNDSAASLSAVSERSQDSEGVIQYSSSVVKTMHETERCEQQPYDSSSSPSIVFLSNEDSLIQGRNVTSSPSSSKVLLLKSGQPLHWREMDADKGSFNFYQIVGFLGNAWEILQDCDPGGSRSQGTRTGRISYYSDQ